MRRLRRGWGEDRSQRTEARGQKSEVRRQKTEVRLFQNDSKKVRFTRARHRCASHSCVKCTSGTAGRTRIYREPSVLAPDPEVDTYCFRVGSSGMLGSTSP